MKNFDDPPSPTDDSRHGCEQSLARLLPATVDVLLWTRFPETHLMKTLTIEWKHLDQNGSTCERCDDTGTTLRQTVRRLRRCLRSRDIAVRLVETKLTAACLAESNTILFNTVPLETVLGDACAGSSDCESCGELLDAKVQCRTLERAGKTHEAIPAEMICEAACRVAGCEDCGCSEAKPCGPKCGC
jgi:hypothetical protein